MTTNSSTPHDKKVQILIVDDHPLVREGFKALISTQPDLEVSGEAASFSDAIELSASSEPDLVIIDLSLAGGSGLELIKRFHARSPSLRMLVCSMHDESLFAERVLKAGAHGYINKQEVTDHVINAIRHVMSGNIYLSETLTQRMLQGLSNGHLSSIDDLSDRELEVFGLIGQGIGTSQIAEQLHLSVKTVETHREKIKKKLHLASASELTRYAMQWSLERG